MKCCLRTSLAIVIVFVVLAVAFIVMRMDEDTWICSDGVWVQHGSPSAPMPEEPCL